MASVLCVLLRTPRKRLGVLHLDRGPMQKPFTKDDLRLADALAANVSAGIESAQLLQKQRELFLSMITILATAVELRGCPFASSAGGLKSTCVSLLELSPTAGPRSSTCTRSERGGAILGARFFVASFAGADCAGVSSGKELS